MAITVTIGGVGPNLLPHAVNFTPNGTRATVTTSQPDGVLIVGQEYTINVTAPDTPLGRYTAKYVDVDVTTYRFDNLLGN